MTSPRLIVATALAMLLLSGPAVAQQTAAAGLRANDDSIAEPRAVDLWQADRTRIFDASEVDVGEFIWVARPLVIFADSPLDPSYQQQLELLTTRIDDLVERDVVVITDTDPSAATALRRDLRPRGFLLALVGKDGSVALRKPLPWDVRELGRSIDKMPLRQQEIRERRNTNQ